MKNLVEADLEELGDAVDVGLVKESSDQADVDGDQDLDEDESSACAPYLARQMSCLGSWTPGVKNTPFLGSARGVKDAETPTSGRTSSRPPIYVLASNTETQGVTHIQAARRLKALLLHVWIEWFIMV